MSGSQDPLNLVLLDARKDLQNIQASLQKKNVNYSEVLNQLSETTDKYQTEAESLLNERYTDSNIIPIQATVSPTLKISKKQKNLLQQIRATSPQEIKPFKTNKAMDLRLKSTTRPIHVIPPGIKSTSSKQVVPPLKNIQYDRNTNVLELYEKGIIKDSDNIDSFLPGIDTTSNSHSINAPLFPNLQIDIPGAARAYRIRREARQRQIEETNKQIEQIRTMPPEAIEQPPHEKPLETYPTTPTAPIQEEIKEEKESSSEEIPQREEKTPINGPRMYEDLQDEFAYQTLLVVRGKIARDTPDFESFQRTNNPNWNKINDVLKAIEDFCEIFNIQFAEINGRKLGEAARLKVLTFDDVHNCLVNVDEFINKKQNEAAIVIQRNVRIFLGKVGVEKRKMEWKAAYRIQMCWHNYIRQKSLVQRNEDRTRDLLNKATFLTEAFKVDTSMKDVMDNEVVSIHVLASLQDLTRTFQLIYKNMEIVIIMTELPPAHIWEDIVDFFAQSGIPDVNERIHFIQLREMNSNDGISHRLQCDMRSIAKIQKILRGRLSFIVPHSDWFSEQRLSADLNIPIFGIVETTEFQSRGAIKNIFSEAEVSTPLSTTGTCSIAELFQQVSRIIYEHDEIDRYVIRYGFSQSEKSIGYFDATPDIRTLAYLLNAENKRKSDPDVTLDDFINEVTQSLKINGSIKAFFRMVQQVGGMIEAMPPIIYSFPSVACLLSGDKKISVIGTFDRLHYMPYHFAASLIPSISVNQKELVARAKQVASVLTKKGVVGHVIVDFLAYNNGLEIDFTGFDIRTNAYPAHLYSAYMTLCSGYNEETGRMVLLKNIGENCEKAQRYCIIQSCVTHPGMQLVGMNDIRKSCFTEGLFFDLLNRTGFKFVFFDTPSKGKGFTLTSATSAFTALSLMIKAYSYLMKFFGMKAGTDSNSSLANGYVSMKEFKRRVFPDT